MWTASLGKQQALNCMAAAVRGTLIIGLDVQAPHEVEGSIGLDAAGAGGATIRRQYNRSCHKTGLERDSQTSNNPIHLSTQGIAYTLKARSPGHVQHRNLLCIRIHV